MSEKINIKPEVTPAMTTKLGFTPDVLVRVVGVTMGDKEGRQDTLEKASLLSTPLGGPPVKLVREPTNKFDPGAVKVYIGTDVGLVNGVKTWEYSFAGYLPREIEIPVRDSKGQLMMKNNEQLLFPVSKLMDYIEAKQAPGILKAAVHFIVKAPGTTTYGIELGLRHNV